MIPEQQRKIIEAAAKAYGIECEVECFPNGRCIGTNQYNEIVFDPLDNSADTASMCAKLHINTFWHIHEVGCWANDYNCQEVIRHYEHHDDTDAGKEAAQRLAASMVAAKIGGYTDV